MYNWRLLLLAVFAVFQPIASFTERNLVDGRPQCCDHRPSRDTTYSLYGDNRFKSESLRINDQRRDIREVRRDEGRSEKKSVSPPGIDSYREREIRESPDLRTRLSRTELHQQRESRIEVLNDFIRPEQRARILRVTDTFTERSAENRRDNRFRGKRIDESRIFRTRNVNENLEQRNLERRTIDSRRETRLMRNNVDEIRKNRDIRVAGELRRTRDNIIRTDRFIVVENQRILQDASQDRRTSTTSFVKRDQRSVRSLNRLSKGSNDERRLSFENFRIAKQERDNRDVRTRQQVETRTEAERNSIERTEGDREIGSRFSTTRQVLRNQRSVRSLDRLSRGCKDDRRISFENFRTAKQERDNRDVRARQRQDVRTESDRSSIEIAVRERTEEDREIGSRFSTTRQVLRNQRSVRSLDRLSRGSSDGRRLFSENGIIAKQEHEVRARERDQVRNEAERSNTEIRVRERPEADREVSSLFSTTRHVLINQRSVRSLDSPSRGSDRTNSRDVRVRERHDVRKEKAQRYTETRVRQRSEVDREIGSRFSLSRKVDNNKERRLSIADTRRNNERLFSTTNFGDRTYQINSEFRERNNDDGYSQLAARSRMEAARERTDERITTQMRNMREDSRGNYRGNYKDVSLKDRRARELTGRRLSQSETKLFENSRAHRSSNSRDREINEKRTVYDRVMERMQNQRVQLREITSNFAQRENAVRTLIRNREEREHRDDARASRGRTTERRSLRERVGSEQRDARSELRISEIRNARFGDNERRFRAASESRIIQRENPQARDNVRVVEQRNTRELDQRRDSTRNVSKNTERQNIDSHMKLKLDFSRNNINTFGYKKYDTENKAHENNWQNLIYTMQGIYLCSIFIPMLINSDKKKAKSLGLWTPFQNLIKTD